jgi:hypothetical protein
VSELENQLRRLAANGELTYLSIIPVVGKGYDGGNTVFAAQVSPASRFGHSEGRDPDPVAAILKAIAGLPKSFVKEPKPERRVTVSERIMTGQKVRPGDGPGILATEFGGKDATQDIDRSDKEPWDE